MDTQLRVLHTLEERPVLIRFLHEGGRLLRCFQLREDNVFTCGLKIGGRAEDKVAVLVPPHIKEV